MNNNRKLKVLTILVSAAISNLSGISVVSASVVNNLLPYQIYRDFAENKGDFIPGTESLELYNNSGLLVTTLNKAPCAVPALVTSTGTTSVTSLFNLGVWKSLAE